MLIISNHKEVKIKSLLKNYCTIANVHVSLKNPKWPLTISFIH